jgi:hypothetical protein
MGVSKRSFERPRSSLPATAVIGEVAGAVIHVLLPVT